MTYVFLLVRAVLILCLLITGASTSAFRIIANVDLVDLHHFR